MLYKFLLDDVARKTPWRAEGRNLNEAELGEVIETNPQRRGGNVTRLSDAKRTTHSHHPFAISNQSSIRISHGVGLESVGQSARDPGQPISEVAAGHIPRASI